MNRNGKRAIALVFGVCGAFMLVTGISEIHYLFTTQAWSVDSENAHISRPMGFVVLLLSIWLWRRSSKASIDPR